MRMWVMKKTSRRSSKSKVSKEKAVKSARAKVVKSAREKTRKVVLMLIGVLVVIWMILMGLNYGKVDAAAAAMDEPAVVVVEGDRIYEARIAVMYQFRCLEAACAVPGPFEPVEDR